jgi:hypothetical protein
LGNSFALPGTALIDPKNAMFVAVEGHRLAVLPEIVLGGLSLVEKTFAVYKA